MIFRSVLLSYSDQWKRPYIANEMAYIRMENTLLTEK